MKSFRELTVAAKQSRLAGISRETFLANLHPSERSDAAMQFDRLGRLTVNLHADEDYLAARLGLAALAH